MSVDTKDRPTNIKGLAIPEVTVDPDLIFDAERDIPPEMLEHMKLALNFYEMAHLRNLFSTVAASMAILFPDRIDELALDSDTLHKMGLYSGSHWNFPEDSLAPEHIKILSVKDWEEAAPRAPFGHEFEDIKSRLETTLHIGTFEQIFKAYILYPERFSEIQNIECLKLINEKIIIGNFRRGSGASDLLSLSLLHPEKNYLEEFSREELIAIRDIYLKSYEMHPDRAAGRSSEWGAIRQLAALKMLLAQEIKMTPQGLQIIMPGAEASLTSSPQVPQAKKY